MRMENNKKYIGSVMKAMEILNVIAESESGLGVTDVSKRLSLGVSSTYHLVNTLKASGMVAQNPHTKKYSLGPGMFRISARAQNHNPLGKLAQPYLDRLSRELQETANLGVLEGGEIVCSAQAEGPKMSRIIAKIGGRAAFYHAAGGKMLVSLKPREVWDGLIRDVRFEKYTENTILSMSDLVKELEITRKRGYGVDNEEREEGVVCVAVPLYDAYAEPIASISISGPSVRVGKRVEEVVERIREVADELSAELGYASGFGTIPRGQAADKTPRPLPHA
jgi:DNA-binding IclR family transcriptional regulator